MSQKLQILRTIDKFDRIGRDGVLELLQKPEEEFGAGLDLVRATLIADFIAGAPAETNEETLENMRQGMKHITKVGRRLKLMTALEEIVCPDGETQWEKLLNLPTNDDETWSNGGPAEQYRVGAR